MSNSVIPPPVGADMGISLERMYSHTAVNGDWVLLQSIIRRCHAAEQERTALERRVAELEPVHQGMGSDLMAYCGQVKGISGHDQALLTYRSEQITCPKCLQKYTAVLMERIAELEKQVFELEAELHDCPVCHRKCKECDCVEKRIAELEGELKHAKAAHEDMRQRNQFLRRRLDLTVDQLRRNARYAVLDRMDAAEAKVADLERKLAALETMRDKYFPEMTPEQVADMIVGPPDKITGCMLVSETKDQRIAKLEAKALDLERQLAAVRQAVEAEREACAQIAEDKIINALWDQWDKGGNWVANRIAVAIRSRSESSTSHGKQSFTSPCKAEEASKP